LPAFAAIFKWHGAPFVAVLSSVNILFHVC
jgi:hypothetical protein